MERIVFIQPETDANGRAALGGIASRFMWSFGMQTLPDFMWYPLAMPHIGLYTMYNFEAVWNGEQPQIERIMRSYRVVE